jgi:mitotic-spindle organizing protein 1
MRADQTGLDKQTLSICVGMIEAGANPDTLAVSLFFLRG